MTTLSLANIDFWIAFIAGRLMEMGAKECTDDPQLALRDILN